MFGRKKNKDVDWTSSLGQPVVGPQAAAPPFEAGELRADRFHRVRPESEDDD